jgi:hypothetical protein
MAISKKSLLMLAFAAVAGVALYKCSTDEQPAPGNNATTPFPRTAIPEPAPVVPPVVTLPEPGEVTPAPAEGLTAEQRQVVDRCIEYNMQALNRSLAQPTRDAVVAMTRALAATGTEIIPYHINTICNRVAPSLQLLSIEMKVNQCANQNWFMPSVHPQQFRVEICKRADNTMALGAAGVKLVP